MISFREVIINDAKTILTWRAKKRVTKYMVNDIDLNMDNHIRWLKRCYAKKNYYHWIIQCNGVDIGLINLADYDENNKTTSWGIYIGNDAYLGAGAFVPLYFYNFVFNDLGVDEIHAEVFYDNVKTIKLHLFHGYVFTPNKDRIIIKNDKEILLINLTLNRGEFLLKRKSTYVSDFPLLNWIR